MATVFVQLGEIATAKSHIERSLDLAIRGSNPELEASALMGLIRTALWERDGQLALDVLDELEWNDAMAHNVALQVKRALLEAETALMTGNLKHASTRASAARNQAFNHDLWPLLWSAEETMVRIHHTQTLTDPTPIDRPGKDTLKTTIQAARVALGEFYARIEDADLVESLQQSKSVTRMLDILRTQPARN